MKSGAGGSTKEGESMGVRTREVGEGPGVFLEEGSWRRGFEGGRGDDRQSREDRKG